MDDTIARCDRPALLLPWLLIAALVVTAIVLAGCSDSGTTEETDETSEESSQDEDTAEEGDAVDESDDAAAEFALVMTPELTDGQIPVEYANFGVDGGENVSIPADWQDPPEGTESYALVFVDRHPIANEWVHWMALELPPDATGFAEGASGTTMPAGTIELDNTWGETGYGGPEPPAGSGDHEYELIVYALDVPSVDLAQQNTFAQFTDAVEGNVLAEASWTGTFGR